MPKNVVREAFDLVLEVAHQSDDGEPVWTVYDVTETVLNFALNRIPSAHCALAVGRNARTQQAATIHGTAHTFVQNLPARIWLYPFGDWLPQEAHPRWEKAQEAVIFEGYVAGLGYQRSRGVTSPVVYLSHWLSDLSFSSALSDQSHPGNPAYFRWPASSRAGVQTTAATEFLTNRTDEALFSDPNIQADFWAKTLHPMFYQLSKEDLLWRIGAGDCEGLPKSNATSQKALRRLETHLAKTDEVGTAETGGGSPYYVPLSMELGGIPAQLSRAMADYFRRAQLEVYFNATTWDKLIEFASVFKFGIVPKVQTAQFVPLVPGLRTTYAKDIDIRDVFHMESSAVSVRPLRGVGVLPGTLQTDILDQNMRPAQSLNRLGGCWSPGPQAEGMLMYVQPPVWLNGVLQDLHEPGATLFRPDPRSATTPRTGPADPDPGHLVVVDKLAEYFQWQAHYVYAQEMLRGRYTTIQSRLRFDIAPGTNVAVRNAPRKFIAADQLSGDYVGTVTKVGILLNASAPLAATSFQLDYTRTAGENEDDRTSIDAHPLYSSVFTGAPLLDAYAFPET